MLKLPATAGAVDRSILTISPAAQLTAKDEGHTVILHYNMNSDKHTSSHVIHTGDLPQISGGGTPAGECCGSGGYPSPLGPMLGLVAYPVFG
jgi:hypothetical protein